MKKQFKQLISLYLIILIVLSPIVIAQNGDPVGETFTEDFTTLDESYYESGDQGQWLVDNYGAFEPGSGDWLQYQGYMDEFYLDLSNIGTNEETDAIFFTELNEDGTFKNYEGNEEAFDTFFSGAFSDNPSETTKSIFRNEYTTKLPEGASLQESAAKYLTEKFGAPYTISNVGDDFTLNLGSTEPYEPATMKNNDETIIFSNYENANNIQEIVAYDGGIKIIEKQEGNEAGREITFEGAAEINYDAASGEFALADSSGEYHLFNIDRDSKSDDSINFEFNEDGSITVTGPVSGNVLGSTVRFNNRDGELYISADGNIIDADNAEVITPTLYADGNFRKEGNDIQAWAHGAGMACFDNCDDDDFSNDVMKSMFGNIDPYQTVVVDRTTDVGVMTQGQSGENQITIHLDQDTDRSYFADQPPREESTIEDLQQRAREVQPPEGDWGDNGEVWIKKDKTSQEITVTSKGKVDVGFYNVDPQGPATLNQREPHFIGESGVSEFDVQVGGEKDDLQIRGPATYSDEQYSKIILGQDGASLRIQRPLEPQKDAIVADCFNCQFGESISVTKNIVVVEKATAGYEIYREVTSSGVDISLIVTEDGLVPSYSTEQLGEIGAAMTEGQELIMGRDMVIKTFSGTNKEYNVQIAQDTDNFVQGFIEKIEIDEFGTRTVIEESPIHFGVSKITGGKNVIVSEEEYQNVQTVLDYLEQGDYETLAVSGIRITDPNVRELIKDETYFDVGLIDNPDYMDKIGEAVGLRETYFGYQQDVFERYGLELNDQGVCISGEACQAITDAISKQEGLAWHASRAELKALEAKNAMTEALAEAGEITNVDAQESINENNKKISDLNKMREWLDQQVTVQEIESGKDPVGSNEDILTVENFAVERKTIVIEKAVLEHDLSVLKAKLSATPEGVQGIIEQQRIEEEVLEIEDRIQQIDNSVAHYDRVVAEVASKYAADRPDFATDLCSRAHSGCAEEFYSQTLDMGLTSEVSDKAATEMTRYNLEKYNDLAGASKLVDTLSDETRKQEANEMLWKYTLDQLEQQYKESERLVTEKRSEDLEKYSGFFGFLSYSADAVSQPISLVAMVVPNMPTVYESYHEEDRIAQERLQQERNGQILINNRMQAMYQKGYTVSEAFNIISTSSPSEYGVLYDENTGEYKPDLETYQDLLAAVDTGQYHNLEKTANGEYLTADDIAREEFDQIQRLYTFNGDRVYPIKNEIIAYNDRNPDSNYGKDWTETQIDYLEGDFENRKRGLKYQPFISEDTVIVPELMRATSAENWVGVGLVGGAFRTSPSIVRAELTAVKYLTSLGSKAKTGATAVLRTEKIAAVGNKIKPVTSVLTKDIGHLSSAGRSFQAELKVAKQIGDPDLIKRAEDAMAAWKSTKSVPTTNVFTTDLTHLVTAESRQAWINLRKAKEGYELGITSADELLVAAQKYKLVTDPLAAAKVATQLTPERQKAFEVIEGGKKLQDGVDTGTLPRSSQRAAAREEALGNVVDLRQSKAAGHDKLVRICASPCKSNCPTQEAAEHYFKQSGFGYENQAVYSDRLIKSTKQGETVQVAAFENVGAEMKFVNENYGHSGGNNYITAIGKGLEEVFEPYGIKVTHKRGKSFKLTCIGDCGGDLAEIITKEMDNFRTSVRNNLDPKIKLPEKINPTTGLPETRPNFYVGVSQKEALTGTASIDEATKLANKLNRQSLDAGKLGQLTHCGKTGHCTQVVRHGSVDDALKQGGVKYFADDAQIDGLKSAIANNPKLKNELEYFGEDLEFINLDELFAKRQAILNKETILTAQDYAKVREIDYEILTKTMKYQDTGNKQYVDGVYDGNENMKTFVNYLLYHGPQTDLRRTFVVGGDEVGFVIHRPGKENILPKTSLGRADFNFFGDVNAQHGVKDTDAIKDWTLEMSVKVMDDAKQGKTLDTDEAIATEIVRRFNNKMVEDDIRIVVEVDTVDLLGNPTKATIETRPGLSIGFTDTSGEVGEQIKHLTKSGEKNGASILNMVADEAAEAQKKIGKQRLLKSEGDVKEVIPENFVATGKVTDEHVAKIGKLEERQTDNLVAEFIVNDGDLSSDVAYQIAKPGGSVEGTFDEIVSGASAAAVN